MLGEPKLKVTVQLRSIFQPKNQLANWVSLCVILWLVVGAYSKFHAIAGMELLLAVPIIMAGRRNALAIWFAIAVSAAAILFVNPQLTLLERLLSIAVIGVVGLVTKDMRGQVRIWRELSLRDHLTGLLNRRGLEVRYNRIIKSAARQGRQVYVVVADCDKFKEINDTYGHKAGDNALKAVAAALQAQVQSCGEVARLGGDEFALVFHAKGNSEALMVLRNASRSLTGTQAETPSISWGSARYGRDGQDLDRLIRCADRRLYERRRLFRPIPMEAVIASLK